MRCSHGLTLIVVAIIQRVRPRHIDKRPKMHAILHGSFRDELPHSLGDSLAGRRSADIGVKVALDHCQVKELRRKSLVQKLLGNGSRIAVRPGLDNRSLKSAGRLPKLDVLVHFGHEIRGHIQLALSEDPRHPKHEPLLLRHLWVVNFQACQVAVVVVFHLAALRLNPFKLVNTLLVIGSLDGILQVGDVDVQTLHGVEDFLCHPPLLCHLLVLEECKAANAKCHGGKRQNHSSVLAFLFLLNLGKDRSDEHGMLARLAILVAFAEIMLCILGFIKPCVAHGTAHDNGLQDAKAELRPLDAQASDRAFLQLHLWNAGFADVDAVTAFQIAQPPFAILKEDFGVEPADIVVLDADFA